MATGHSRALLTVFALAVFCGCISVADSKLTVLTLPEALVSSSGNVVEGSVIQIYCTVEGDTNVTFSWTLNGTTLLNDPPHIRMRENNSPERSASLLTDDSTSVLTVDNFRVSDNGVYQCIAANGSSTSGNGAAVELTAVSSTANGTLGIMVQPSDMEPVDLLVDLNDNRTGVALGGTIDGSVMTCTAGHQGDELMNYSLPSVVWVRDGQAVDNTDSRITITSTTMANGQLTSSLTITNFAAGDAGVYQCVFTDDSDGGDTEIITSIPYQLDTGNTIHIERVSPEVILLRPPEKLVIEVKVSGDYQVLFWTKDGSQNPNNAASQEYPNFHEIFVRGSTTLADEGIYLVQPQFKPGTQQTHSISPVGDFTFGVTPPVDASTTALSGPVVVIPEGDSQDILCTSTGAPVPSITWQFNNQTSEFEQTDMVNQFDATLIGTGAGTTVQLTPGNIESTLHIVSARYPDHDGVYTCVGTNTDDLTVASSSASIMVQINVVPEVEITATRTLVGVGEDVTLSCVILRGNPANYNTTITHTGTGNSFPGPTLILTGFQATDNGTYSCEVTNDAGTGSANVTIELGDPPVVTTLQPGPVIVSSTVELVCVVTGDTPIDIVWERLYSNGSVQVVYAGNDTTGGNFTLTATLDSFGIYRCNATSCFGMDSSSINITQAVGPTLPADENVEIVVGTSLNLTVIITGFNLPLTEIIWFIDSVPAIPSPGGLTITDSSTDSPPALSTLTIDPVQSPSQGGLYSVRAVNPAGSDITTFNVTVTAPATIIFPIVTDERIVTEGDQTTLTCTARGTPAPQFVWFRGGEQISNSDSRLLISGDEMLNTSTGFYEVTSSLNISTIDRTDFRSFRCEASNIILGSPSVVSIIFNITVNFPPTVLESPSPVSVFAPTPFSLSCTVEGHPPPTIVWTRSAPNGEVTEFSSPRAYLELTEQTAGLSITSNLTSLVSSEQDIGNWSCRANNSVGMAISDPAQVVIYFGAQVVSLISGQAFRVNETANITFICVATGLPAPVISFLRGSEMLDAPRFVISTQPAMLLENSTFLVTSSLTLINAMDEDTGNGTCRAMNTAIGQTMVDEVTIDFTVNVAATITTGPMNVSIVSPEPAAFTCTADGVPRPDISWLRVDNGTEVQVMENSIVMINTTMINDRMITSALRFSETQPFRSGTYLCVTSNLLGMDRQMAELVVNDLPQIIIPPEDFMYTVDEGDPVTLNCSASGIPAPTITWSILEQSGPMAVNSDTRITVTPTQVIGDYVLSNDRGTAFLVSSQLTISTAEDGDSGQYQCQAGNEFGNEIRKIELVVQVAPEITMAPTDVTVVEGMSASFLCVAMGRPRPNITWYRESVNDSIVPVNVSDPRVTVTPMEMGDRRIDTNLTIDDVLPSDSSEYFCFAENAVRVGGRVNDSASLTVNVQPMVTSVYPEGVTSYTVNETDSVLFQCTATGIPAPMIFFDFGAIATNITINNVSSPVEISRNKDREIVYQVTRTAVLDNAMDADSGVYVCTAGSDIGMDNQTFELIVQVSPRVTQSPVDVTIIEGSEAVFECQASARPRPDISWEFYSPTSMMATPITNDMTNYIITNMPSNERLMMSTLTVLSSATSDFGVYRCVTSNVVGMDSVNASLTVHVPPVISSLEPGQRLVVNQTDSASFICKVTGLPTPLIRWYRGDLLLNGTGTGINSRVTVESCSLDGSLGRIGLANSTLTISGTVGNDSDNYTCVATNRLINNTALAEGREEESVTLFVQVPPVVVPLSTNQREVASEGESANLSFRIDNASPLVMASNICWFYSASNNMLEITDLTNRTASSILNFSNDRLSLTIDNIVQARSSGEETDQGRYTLQATNEAGVSSSYIDLLVIGPPVITEPPINQFAINNGSDAVFSCVALAIPQHNVSWSFNGTTLDTSDSTKYSVVVDNSSSRFGELMIMSVDYEDRGVYTCLAANSIGSVIASANLTVHVVPEIRDISTPSEVQLDRPAVLACLTVGFPTPSISWRKDGEQVSIYSDSSLSTRLDIIEFSALSMDANTTDFESSGYTGSGTVMGLLMMYTEVTVDEVRQLGELGVVGLLSFGEAVRGDTADYTCVASNSLPETTTLVTVSDNIPLVVLERPDPPANVTASIVGARWVVLTWTPTFTGNRPLTSFPLFIRSVDISENFTETSSVRASDTMSSGGNLMYNISAQGVILPYTNYSFTVVACNTIGCSDQSDSSPIIRTNQDASSPPTITGTIPTQTTIVVNWTKPDLANGVITGYGISYVGSKNFDPEFSDVNNLTFTIDELGSSTTDSFSQTLTDLTPSTRYEISVFAINGAGDGMADSVAVITQSAPPPPPTDTPVVPIRSPGQNPLTVVINVVDFSEINGPISHVQIVVVFLPGDVEVSSLSNANNEFPQDSLLTQPISCDNKPSSPTAYITAEMSGDLYEALPQRQFVVGQNDDNNPASPNDRPDLYTNGPLCFSTRYTLFIRAFVRAQQVEGSRVRRQAFTDERQYTDFQSSTYVSMEIVTGEAPADSTPIIAAVIIVIIVVVLIVVGVVVVIVVLKRRRTYEYKTTHKDTTDNDQGVETLKLTDYRPPDEASVIRHPLPLSVLPSHVERMHVNENCGFGEEYRIIQEKSPKKAVETCITPENKPRNRYANIQCFDETRVHLTPIEGAEHDYINANFIEGYNRPKEYIAAQGPLPDTLGDFWRMIWDYNVPTIVMLTNLVEKMKIKCSQYWPNVGHQQYSNIDVTLVNTITQADFVIRHFHIKKLNSDEVKEVRQFHFLSWPDFGVPRHATPLLHVLRRVRNIHSYSNERPLVIHCSAGVGRTGTLITIDVELQRAMHENMVDPFNFVSKLREQRNFMVQTEAQYVFLHDAILEGVSSGTTEVKVEKLTQRFAELEKVDQEDETGFQQEYGRLRQFKVDVKEFTDANDDANKFKNRIHNALPYNYNRVHLQMSPGVGGSDYINASYIDGYAHKGAYIATQGPLPNTVDDFWRMVWEKEVYVIVMLTQLEEKGKEQCALYWPESANAPEKMGSLTIEMTGEKEYEDYVLRELKVSDVTSTDGKSRIVKQYHFMAWPSDGAPSSGAGMIDLIDQVTRTQAQTGNKPIVVHCSAGIGRTGAFCALSTSIDRVKTEGLVDVFHCVKHLRTQRPHMVQSVEQYAFCYVALREYIDSLSSYSNFQ